MLNIERTRTGTNQLSAATLKDWMKVDTTADDVLIISLISQGRDIVESFINQTLPLTTITATTDLTESFELPYGPVIEILSVKTRSGQTDIDYTWDGFYVNIPYYAYYNDNLEIIYTAGYDTLKPDIQLAWMETCSYLYENRGDIQISNYLSTNYTLNSLRKKVWI